MLPDPGHARHDEFLPSPSRRSRLINTCAPFNPMKHCAWSNHPSETGSKIPMARCWLVYTLDGWGWSKAPHDSLVLFMHSRVFSSLGIAPHAHNNSSANARRSWHQAWCRQSIIIDRRPFIPFEQISRGDNKVGLVIKATSDGIRFVCPDMDDCWG